jgi:hypothetical protein
VIKTIEFRPESPAPSLLTSHTHLHRLSFSLSLYKEHVVISEEYDWREHGKRKQMPGVGRTSQTHSGWNSGESALVAESVKPEDSPPELLSSGSYG